MIGKRRKKLQERNQKRTKKKKKKHIWQRQSTQSTKQSSSTQLHVLRKNTNDNQTKSQNQSQSGAVSHSRILLIRRRVGRVGFRRGFFVGRRFIGGRRWSFWRWCGRVVAKKSLRQQNLVHHKNRQRGLLSELVVHRHGDDAGGHVDLVRLAGEVQPPIPGQSPHRVADGQQLRQSVELHWNQRFKCRYQWSLD